MLSTGLLPLLKWFIVEVKIPHWAPAGMTGEITGAAAACQELGSMELLPIPGLYQGSTCGNSQSSPPSLHSQCTCTNPWTTNLQFLFVNSELPEGDLSCQGRPWSSQQHMGWAEQKLPWNRQREINFWGWKDLKHHFSRQQFRERDPQTIQQPGFQSRSPTGRTSTDLELMRSISVCSDLIISNPGVLVAQKSCTRRGWFVFNPEPGFSPSLHPWSSCSGGTDGGGLLWDRNHWCSAILQHNCSASIQRPEILFSWKPFQMICAHGICLQCIFAISVFKWEWWGPYGTEHKDCCGN